MDALGFARHLLDPDRLAIVGLVAARPSSAEELAAATGQRLKTVLATLAPLVQAGLVAREDDRYALRPEALQQLARDLARRAPPDRRVLLGMTEDEQMVLGRFFHGNRLVEIPAARSKRRVVLQRLALDFEPGIHYAEAEVNARLQGYHDDYAALRRHLVDEGFLDRGGGEYWRAGGRV